MSYHALSDDEQMKGLFPDLAEKERKEATARLIPVESEVL